MPRLRGAFYKSLIYYKPNLILTERIYKLLKRGYIKLNNGILVFYKDFEWLQIRLDNTITLYEIKDEFKVKAYLEIKVKEAKKVFNNERRV
jgi:hypothetical protein